MGKMLHVYTQLFLFLILDLTVIGWRVHAGGDPCGFCFCFGHHCHLRSTGAVVKVLHWTLTFPLRCKPNDQNFETQNNYSHPGLSRNHRHPRRSVSHQTCSPVACLRALLRAAWMCFCRKERNILHAVHRSNLSAYLLWPIIDAARSSWLKLDWKSYLFKCRRYRDLAPRVAYTSLRLPNEIAPRKRRHTQGG